MPNKMRTFMCETCGAAFQVPVHRGRHHTKCEIHRPAASAPRATRPKATPKAEPVTVQSVAAKATGDPVADALLKAQEQVAALAAAVAEREAQAQAVRPVAEMPEVHHYAFPELLDHLMAECQPYLCGPAASGKTTAARVAAKVLGVPFRFMSCTPEMSETKFFGFVDATGNYRPGILRDAWENGGLVLFDEMDNGNPEALAGLNGVLGLPVGAEFTFPDGANIPRHPEFYVIAAGNTGGHGADDRHVARVVLDGATLDRFTFITWDYDEALERAMVPAEASAWVDRVQALRKAAKAAGDALYITPRATERGARMLARGMSWDRVEAANIWKDVPDDTRRAVLAHV